MLQIDERIDTIIHLKKKTTVCGFVFMIVKVNKVSYLKDIYILQELNENRYRTKRKGTSHDKKYSQRWLFTRKQFFLTLLLLNFRDYVLLLNGFHDCVYTSGLYSCI